MKKRNWPRSISLIPLGLSSSFLISCATIPDVPLCVEINPTRGWCTWTISDKEQYVDETNLLNGETWWAQRPSLVLVPAPSWAEIKTSFIKLCKKNGNCAQDIDKWERKFDKVKRGD